MLNIREYITIDREVLGGRPVFKGTRVTVEALFDHLEKGVPLNEFLQDFPAISKAQAVAVIEIASQIMTSKNLEKLYETAA